MANHALPTTSSLYTDVLTNLKDRIDDSLKMLDSVNTSPTSVPTNAVRWNSTTNLWEKYTGSEWVSLAASYAIQVLKSSNLVGGNSTTLLGSIPYQSNTNTTTLLAPNTTTTRKFLRQTGSGTNGSAPVWDTILASDIPTLNQNTTGNAGTATTATNQSGGSVDATTGRFANDIIASQSITIGTGGNYSAGSIYSNFAWGMIFRAKQPSPSGAHFRWADSNDTELFRFNGTALTTNITGNSGTSTALVGDETNWATYRSRSVANMLSWKHPGNGHCIFDASASTSPTGSAVNNTNPTSPWAPTFPTLMGWSGIQTYGVRVDSARVADSTTYASAFTTAVGSAPSYACRAWVNFNGTGTVAIRASGNVSSITDNGTGYYTVNFTTAMPDANYSGSIDGRMSAGFPVNGMVSSTLPTTSSFGIYTYRGDNAPSLTDTDYVLVNVFR